MKRSWILVALAGVLLSACAPSVAEPPVVPVVQGLPSLDHHEAEKFVRFLLTPLMEGDARSVMGGNPEAGYDEETALCLYGSFRPRNIYEQGRLLRGAALAKLQGLGVLEVVGVGRSLLERRGLLTAFVKVRLQPGGPVEERVLYVRLLPSAPHPWGEFCPDVEGGLPDTPRSPELFYKDLLAWYRLTWGELGR